MDLAGNFEIIFIYRVVPAFDVDAAGKAAPAQFTDDIRPVAVAKARCPMEYVLVRPMNPVCANHVPQESRILAVHMKNPVYPLAQLG